MRYLKTALAMVLFAALAACTSTERKEAEKQGSVSATGEFVKHFGPAPSVDKGTAFAFVVYFPSAREPGKVIPFPFFSFDEASLKRVALAKLVGGLGEVRAYQGVVSQLFPVGTRVLDVTQAGGRVTANFSKELAGGKRDPATERALANAIVLTLRQFEGVSEVTVQVEGAPNNLDKRANKADESAVVPDSRSMLPAKIIRIPFIKLPLLLVSVPLLPGTFHFHLKRCAPACRSHSSAL